MQNYGWVCNCTFCSWFDISKEYQVIYCKWWGLFCMGIECYLLLNTVCCLINWRLHFLFLDTPHFWKKKVLLFWKGSFLSLCQGERERLGFRKHKFDDPARREQPQDIEVLNYTEKRVGVSEFMNVWVLFWAGYCPLGLHIVNCCFLCFVDLLLWPLQWRISYIECDDVCGTCRLMLSDFSAKTCIRDS